jgi:integrase
LLVLLLAFGGLRIGEALALRRASVDLDAGRVIVSESLADVTVETGELADDGIPVTRTQAVFGPTKTHQQRTLSLPSFVLDRVGARLLDIGPCPDQLLFASKTGAP